MQDLLAASFWIGIGSRILAAAMPTAMTAIVLFPVGGVIVTHKGKKVDAVAQITKYGYVFLLDRRTGKPLFKIRERKTPPSPLDGEVLAKKQPAAVPAE